MVISYVLRGYSGGQAKFISKSTFRLLSRCGRCLSLSITRDYMPVVKSNSPLFLALSLKLWEDGLLGFHPFHFMDQLRVPGSPRIFLGAS